MLLSKESGASRYVSEGRREGGGKERGGEGEIIMMSMQFTARPCQNALTVFVRLVT